jgi:hypothetical protein
MKPRCIVFVAILVVLSCSGSVYAWGPATHVKLASDLLENLHLLSSGLGALLATQRKHFVFGNIAADIVVAKRWSRVKQFCHHWKTGFVILDDARSDAGKAFALGYLSHLAADTVAHNKFLPRQMTLTRTTMGFGHLYWELRADATIGPYYWDMLRSVLQGAYEEHEANLRSNLRYTFLPFSINRRLFYRMNRFVSRQFWIGAMNAWTDWSRWHLPDELMREYRRECLDRIVDVVLHQRSAAVLHEDPNGNAALSYTKHQRRQLRQMMRAGLIAPHVMYEAQIVHGPRVPIDITMTPSVPLLRGGRAAGRS